MAGSTDVKSSLHDCVVTISISDNFKHVFSGTYINMLT